MFEKFIINQNKQWQNNPLDAGFKREIMADLTKLINIRQIIALIGVRRCGKSTIVKQLINYLIQTKKTNPKNILFLNLESPYLNKYKEDPQNLQKIYEEYLAINEPKGKIFVFLDEVQFFTSWQVFVKSLYEKGGVKFFITGSNSKLLSAEMATMLSGRSISKIINPFSFIEIVQINKIDPNNKIELHNNEHKILRLFKDYFKNGGFPEIVLEKEADIRQEILVNYYKNILYQDIIPRFEVKKTKQIENLLIYLLSNIGQLYSYNSLSKFSKIHDKTVKEYIDFFEKSFLLFEISNYQYSLKKQENFSKKVYAVDNGFISAVSFSFSENFSHFLENEVFTRLLQNRKEIYYHKEKYECDFIIKDKNKIIQAIQVTKNIQPANEKREIKGLLEAMKKFNLKQGLIITKDQEEDRKVDNKIIKIMPVWKWLLG